MHHKEQESKPIGVHGFGEGRKINKFRADPAKLQDKKKGQPLGSSLFRVCG